MTGRGDIDMLAAEYVLGTLDGAERADVAARRGREPDLDAAIAAWEERLAALNDATAHVTPGTDLLARIEARLDGSDEAPRGAALPGDARIVVLEKRVAFWRRAAWSATALAASLALVIGFRDTLLPGPPQSFVAVFQKDDQQPAFLLSVDLRTRELVIRPVTAEPQRERTYQLWILAKQLGPQPRSLGLIESTLAGPTRKTLDTLGPDVLRDATFGISLEPPGGSPTGRPTGPALHGRLYPASI
ncbi:MAG: anti-sigma factor [Hyphomicrobiaceae bacterium]|nr:anti-sigma factor [Hyphomicrobiaceae bacterium]